MVARIRDDIDEAFVMQDKATNRARRPPLPRSFQAATPCSSMPAALNLT